MTGRTLLAALAGLLLGLIALLPARLLLPAPPLAAAAVDGSLWRARLAGASLGGAALGDIGLTLAPTALLGGRLQWQVTGALAGGLWRSLAGGGAEALSGRVAAAPLTGLPADVTLAGLQIELDGKGRCRTASGQVSAQLAMPLAGQSSLAGAPRCEGGRLLLPLASADGRVTLDVSAGDGRWQTRLAVAGAGPAEAAALAGAGFAAENGRLVRQEEMPW